MQQLTCEECGGDALDGALGWRAYLVDADDGEAEEAVFFCPACVEREFLADSSGHSARA